MHRHRVRSRRRYLRYLAVYEDTDSTNKRNYDVTLDNVLRHNFVHRRYFFRGNVMVALA